MSSYLGILVFEVVYCVQSIYYMMKKWGFPFCISMNALNVEKKF